MADQHAEATLVVRDDRTGIAAGAKGAPSQ
jgi:hypothetical protein